MTDKHQQRQQRLKETVDAKVAEAQQERGSLVVITGNGKGKSTSGFGTVLRAVGHGLNCSVAQFIKGEWACGERDILEKLGVPFHVMATGFTWDTQDKTADTVAAQAVWDRVVKDLANPAIDMVLLDEITYMLSYHYLDIDIVCRALEARPAHQHVLVTGRACHRRLLEMADTVSEVKAVRHAFDSGVKAQKGLDW